MSTTRRTLLKSAALSAVGFRLIAPDLASGTTAPSNALLTGLANNIGGTLAHIRTDAATYSDVRILESSFTLLRNYLTEIGYDNQLKAAATQYTGGAFNVQPVAANALAAARVYDKGTVSLPLISSLTASQLTNAISELRFHGIDNTLAHLQAACTPSSSSTAVEIVGADTTAPPWGQGFCDDFNFALGPVASAAFIL